MNVTSRFLVAILACLALCLPAYAQITSEADEPAATAVEEPPAAIEEDSADEGAAAKVEGAVDKAEDAVDEVAEKVDQSPEAQKASAGILRPIYELAERMENVPKFYWIAFTIMVAGTVSFALQLVLGKLVVLTRMSISFSEIFSDLLGLAVSLVGLVLTTQAATENSTFTAHAFSVLSATLVGAFAGFIFYWWGQKQELQAALGRKTVHAVREVVPPPGPPRA